MLAPASGTVLSVSGLLVLRAHKASTAELAHQNQALVLLELLGGLQALTNAHPAQSIRTAQLACQHQAFAPPEPTVMELKVLRRHLIAQ